MREPTLLAQVVATSGMVAATSSRTAKRDALADLLFRLGADEVAVTVGFLVGEPRQGRIGVGWRTLAAAEVPPADDPSLTVVEVDRTLTALAALAGSGSAGRRRELLSELLGRATEGEAHFLVRLLTGELRQGALAGVMADAVARAAAVPAPTVRRAAMLGGDLPTIAHLALTAGAEGLAAVGLEVGRPVQPMLASTAESVGEAVAGVGHAVVDWKLDGIRIQAHRDGEAVLVVTRNLNDITDRLPEVVAIVRSLAAERLVLDGEALLVDEADRPLLFQDTASRVSTDTARTDAVRPYFFDLLHRDGQDLIDAPLAERRAALDEVAGPWRVPGTVTDDGEAAEAVLAAALAAGHEGVVVKAAASPYEAGRRGKAWRKVKPVHTFDLVVLAAEWGHGRRTGWLSNLHLGARAEDGNGFVMVGKTFKGLTDELLRWQTEALLARAVDEERWEGRPRTGVVHVRPELVVEVALDGVQRSTRYAGGIALRFARVLAYRPDKNPAQADSIEALRDTSRDLS
ncbi:ATP-dependent DNA ligase [Iamia sp.]|uniref:ATP-dependent DNA ligase n=1 Tax=Iamia sp. TaxID=2722710 RepID=UPI002D063F37|nr:ATP-dependent DNA ligase [Iamia sp.]HXH56459.1 ATP-dependent DNA ligase [Iamia sp.]